MDPATGKLKAGIGGRDNELDGRDSSYKYVEFCETQMKWTNAEDDIDDNKLFGCSDAAGGYSTSLEEEGLDTDLADLEAGAGKGTKPKSTSPSSVSACLAT